LQPLKESGKKKIEIIKKMQQAISTKLVFASLIRNYIKMPSGNILEIFSIDKICIIAVRYFLAIRASI